MLSVELCAEEPESFARDHAFRPRDDLPELLLLLEEGWLLGTGILGQAEKHSSSTVSE